MAASIWVPGSAIVSGSASAVIADFFIATEGQTVFPYTTIVAVAGSKSVLVQVDGQWIPFSDYVVGDSGVTLVVPLHAGQEVQLVSFGISLIGADADNVSYGYGANSRSQADKNTDLFSIMDVMTQAQRSDVRNFTNNGSLTDVFTAAKERVALAGGGRILVPPGLYPLGTEVAFDEDGVELVGVSREGTQFLVTSTTSRGFNITGSRCGMRGFQITYAGTPGSGATAIRIYGSFCHLADFLILSAETGVEVDSGVANKFRDFDLRGYKLSGVYAHDMNDLFLDNFVMDALTSANGALGGIRLYNKCEAVVVSNGDIIRGQYGMTTDAAAYTARLRPGACKFSQVYFDSSKLNGIRLDKAVEFDFLGCWTSFAGYDDSAPSVAANGIELVQVDGVRFNGGQVVNCHGHGVAVTASAKRVSFLGGFAARENSLVTANTHDGISVAAGATDFRIQSCDLGGTATAFSAGTQRYGAVVEVGASDRYIIADNIGTGNGTGLILDGGTGINKRVENNY